MNGWIEQMASWGQLEEALRLALREGKRSTPGARRFLSSTEEGLVSVGERIRNLEGPSGRFHEFDILDPKPRRICGPCFEDRVLQHAVFAVAGGAFETLLHPHVCACRKGLGTQAALALAIERTQGYRWFLKLDVRHYFETVPRARLRSSLRSVTEDERSLRLLDLLVEAWQPGAERGLPIGALSSQYFANHYLRELDRGLARAGGYVRYMDDMVVWGDDANELRHLAREARETAVGLGLTLKDPVLQRCEMGLPFLGMRLTTGGMSYLAKTRERRRWRGRKAWVSKESEGRRQAQWAALEGRTRHVRRLAAEGGIVFDESAELSAVPNVAAAGTTTRRTARPAIATGTSQATGTTTWASAAAVAPPFQRRTTAD